MLPSLGMALKPLANADGYVNFNSDGEVLQDTQPGRVPGPDEWSFESTGDPALDRILLRCNVIEMQSRDLLVRVKRIEHARRLPFVVELLCFVIGGAVVVWFFS
jgi:hypothetical protein